MEVKILSKCDADETALLGTNTIPALQGIDVSTDLYLSDIKDSLVNENNALLGALSFERKHEYTKELAALDEDFDNRVICVKKFIEANTYSSNKTIAKNAEKLHNKLAGYDLSFYKFGYEKELARAFSLIEEYEKPDMKVLVDSLVGVSKSLNGLKAVTIQLNDLYVKNLDILALKEEIVPSGIQKKVVIDIFNEKLLPYLMVMAQVKKAEYSESLTKISKYIDAVNTKIRTRRSKAITEEEVNSEVE